MPDVRLTIEQPVPIGVSQLRPPGEAVTVYPVILELPGVTGQLQVIEATPSEEIEA